MSLHHRTRGITLIGFLVLLVVVGFFVYLAMRLVPAYLEYMILKKDSSRLSTIDLSEQRFYMMSKKDLWKTGGVVSKDAGSAWYNGYSMSAGSAGTT